MKNTFLLIVGVLAICFASCENEEETPQPKYFSDAQMTALDVLKGTFVNNLIVPGYDTLTTTIVFLEQYNPPVEGEYTDYDTREKSKIYMHGKYKYIYYDGSSTEKYYYISSDADKMYTTSSLKTMSVHSEDFKIVNNNSFGLKEKSDYLWDIYKKVTQ